MSEARLPQMTPLEILSANTPADPPVNVEAIAQQIGLPIYRGNLAPNVAGMIIRDRRHPSPTGFAIHVNANDNPRRQRFTIAHEIAHYILHRDLIGDGITDDVMYRSDLGDMYERQANRMAADILMPAQLVISHYRKVPAIAPLARAFDVSDGAMRIRLQELFVYLREIQGDD